MPTIFEQYPVASWKVGSGQTLYFPIFDLSEEGANRVVERERPYRNGAKCDDTGSKARRWTVQACFENSINESGLEQNGRNLYPDVLNDFIRSADEHEVGDLVLPPTGPIRARLVRYVRQETPDTWDGAKLTLTFVEDNEDSVGARAFNPPSVAASARSIAQTTTFSAQNDAVFDPSLASINELAAELEAIANFPSNTVQDIDSQVGIVVAAANRVVDAFSNIGNGAREQLTDPDASVTQRKLETLKESSHQARRELNPRTVVGKVVDDTTTLFDLAAELGQDAAEIIGLNPSLDPMRVAANTTVRVFE